MPLHRIYHTKNAFTAKEKQELAQRITDQYMAYGLPAFYVNVFFIPLEDESFLIGGKPVTNFVRIAVQHIARSLEKPHQVNGFFQQYEATLAPFIKDKGFDWEISVEEIDRDLWRINGLVPPLPLTKAEQMWVKLNKAVPFDEKDNVVE